MTNASFIWQPKFISPFGDKQVYLVPSVNDQQGAEYNWICVCCSPSYNGVYKYPAENVKNYKKWNNNGRWCYYVPLRDCEFVKKLEEIEVPETIEKIKNIQQEWVEKTNHKKLPNWLLITSLTRKC